MKRILTDYCFVTENERAGKLIKKKCLYCKVPFTTSNDKAVYCRVCNEYKAHGRLISGGLQ